MKYDDELTVAISGILLQLGIKAKLHGYKYLRSAVQITLEDPTSVDLITKILYPKIAKTHSTTPARVERAMRTAICSIDPNNKLKSEIFTEYCDHHTNKEFIAGVAEYMRLN